jgi:hypothetical protein
MHRIGCFGSRIDSGVGRYLGWAPWILALALGCTFDTPLPKEKTPVPTTAPRDFRFAILGTPVEAELVCSESDCNHWYRVDVVEPGEVRAAITRRPGGTGPVIRMLLSELGGKTVARAVAAPGEPLVLQAGVEPGVYELLVQAGMGREPYTLSVSLVKDRPAADEPPEEVP